jgi:regulator of extracellular matrix RemA (YlzA/DUF370 family)
VVPLGNGFFIATERILCFGPSGTAASKRTIAEARAEAARVDGEVTRWAFIDATGSSAAKSLVYLKDGGICLCAVESTEIVKFLGLRRRDIS